MIKAVFDTTLLASILTAGLAEQEGTIRRLAYHWYIREEVQVILSEYILTELKNVFQKKYFLSKLTPDQIALYLQEIRETCIFIPIATVVTGVAPHAKDDPVIATAIDGHTPYIVTGDKAFQRIHLATTGIRVMIPASFLSELESMQQIKGLQWPA